MDYKSSEIESKWQKIWEDKKVYKATEESNKPKYYCLEMFPYPSGRIHMGHVRNYSISDLISRYMRMKGFNVMHPAGWDAFGLPAENAAIKSGVHPAEWTWKNIASMKKQLRAHGFCYDWDREVATCHKDYYRWEQMFFIKMYEQGLVYKKKSEVNWCPDCETILANEQVEDGKCWRCGNQVTTRDLEQWFFKITKYAEELLQGCDNLPGWPERVTTMQKNWIGKSSGVQVNFKIKGSDQHVTIYTTRPDTIYGVTFVSLAPEHPLTLQLSKGTSQEDVLKSFVEKMRRMSKIERTAEGGVKEGVFTGAYAINPLTGDSVPIYAANFVLMDYGTGAVMAVPAHDTRDFDFAKKYMLPIKKVIFDNSPEEAMESAYTGSGTQMNSGIFNGMHSDEAIVKIAEHIEKKGFGRRTVNYRLKDWGVSRQRYWGCPIPVIYCDKCGVVTVPEKDLPVILPEDVKFTGKGDNPLAGSDSFVKTGCPKCSGNARRETDTMDTFVESSWYYARYCSPREEKQALDKKKTDYWLPVDQYIGGIEHAVMHLLYIRFFHKVLRDFGILSGDEPVKNLLTQGMVIKDGFKMSKSRGNIVDPDYIVEKYGADTSRLFCLFAAPPERDLDWSDQGIEGCYRFLVRIFRFIDNNIDTLKTANKANISVQSPLRSLAYKTLLKVTKDIDRFSFNTALAAMMELTNELYRVDVKSLDENGKTVLLESVEMLLTMLNPFAPHVTSELWQVLGHKNMLVQEPWPEFREEALVQESMLIVVQVNGKLRAKIEVPAGADEAEVKRTGLSDANVLKYTEGKEPKKVIYVQGKILNIVV